MCLKSLQAAADDIVIILFKKYRGLNIDIIGDICRYKIWIFNFGLAFFVALNDVVADSFQLLTKPANRLSDLSS